MSAQVVYVCDDPVKAETARQVLIRQGFPENDISADEIDIFVYDARSYSSGRTDAANSKWIVIGRK
ncbi:MULTISPECIES: hypothetical protein [unclassified Caulobacter]|jgi:hypothetical protein|uniref:hypothetical protein n=1 Tax=unclassified Caulobacter TaxID=2648921 RepID=UPI0006FD924E|nr:MULTISPECIES: hypothetical protein [unclassified Caulobacter]KQV56520.1 hypothetical protein ASC62_09305 [Caulobacter sp. Root342]KQV72155.1 hypothetical protein ASC70_00255 [Caulobacter sp. Root343]